MDAKTRDKVRKAKIIGSYYLIVLALANVLLEIYFGFFGWLDIAILAFAFTPLATNKRMIFFIFGWINLIVWFIIFMIVVAAQVENGLFHYWHVLIYLVIAASLFCSLLLIYAGLAISEKRFSFI